MERCLCLRQVVVGRVILLDEGQCISEFHQAFRRCQLDDSNNNPDCKSPAPNPEDSLSEQIEDESPEVQSAAGNAANGLMYVVAKDFRSVAGYLQ